MVVFSDAARRSVARQVRREAAKSGDTECEESRALGRIGIVMDESADPPAAIPPGDGPSRSEVTRWLEASAEGSEDARDRLLELVYHELHTLARAQMRQERHDHTLGATALVSEAYMKLFRSTSDDPEGAMPWTNRRRFYGAAATAMRRILVDHARARAMQKRGGPAAERGDRMPVDVLEAARSSEPEQILALDDAISRLESVDERSASVVRLRFFGGLTQDRIAEVLASRNARSNATGNSPARGCAMCCRMWTTMNPKATT